MALHKSNLARVTLLCGALALPLTACSTTNGEQVGSIVGGVGGAILGAQVGEGNARLAASLSGGVLGAYAGAYVGRQLDARDRQLMGSATETALESASNNQTVAWDNPQSGNSGTVTPTTNYTTASGQECRNFNSSVTASGQTEGAAGTACRQPDGSWKIVS